MAEAEPFSVKSMIFTHIKDMVKEHPLSWSIVYDKDGGENDALRDADGGFIMMASRDYATPASIVLWASKIYASHLAQTSELKR